jgi:hypothetical protein
MTILDSELKWYKSAEVSDAATNGGRLSSTEIISGVLQNVFPHVFKAERIAGSTKYRKIFAKVSNDADETLYNPGYCFDGPTAGDDYCCFWPGTQRDTQGDITGSERKYGAANLKADVLSGASSLTVTVEHADLTGIFQDGDSIRITDKAAPDSLTGNEEIHVIDGAPDVSGTDVTIAIAGTLANAYLAATPTKVASIYEPATDLACTVDNWVETSTSGTYDESNYPVVCDNIGTIEQTWTCTWTDATHVTIVGDTVGTVATGAATSGDIAPINPDFSKPYFTLESAGLGGTWAPGETIVFQTHPAAQPLWEKRVVPAACASLANNKVIAIQMGESA